MEGTVHTVARAAIASTTPDTASAPDVGNPAAGTPSKSQLAYDWIRDRINGGNYSPGYRLVLAQLAGDLGVSVVPVREAIRRLEAEGLVTYERNVGAQVAMVHESEYVYTMETLALVEGAATRLAAPFVTPDHIVRARAVNGEMIACLDDLQPHRFTELNLEFHSVLFEECTNPHILELVHRGWNRLRVLRDSTFGFVPGRARQSVVEHENLLRMIETDAEPLTLELAAREHRTATLDAFLAYQAGHKHPSAPVQSAPLQSASVQGDNHR
ncbi:MAG: GntR family transcriptional regulator [Microbacteriaceae bacterium]|nr:MAG: GntR family transcriptional regulator [Microbacteriaceae bacterium]